MIDPTVNVLTVEEPVEYIIRGARQLRIGPKMDFDQAIRGILRHDPDIVLVGEMRDKDTAEIAIKLANTGHLTFSTLHTNDAPSAVSRLYKMGIEPFLIAYAINIVVAQRLIRTLCPPANGPIQQSELDGRPTEIRLHRRGPAEPHDLQGGGVRQVQRRATRDARPSTRPSIFQSEIRSLIMQSGEEVDEELIREQAEKDGMWTLRRSGIERIKEGHDHARRDRLRDHGRLDARRGMIP